MGEASNPLRIYVAGPYTHGDQESTTPRLKPGACPHPAGRAGLQGRLTAAHRALARYSGGECYVQH